MNSKQHQSASDSALAIQSARDTNIQQGVTPEQMKEIIEAIHAQMPAYVAIAREVVDARLQDLENRLLRRFARGEDVRMEAFADPDFQYLLTQANHGYARSGDEQVRDTLIDLIAQRSKQTERTRLTLSLNEAIERSVALTKNEFAELSLAYLLTRTRKTVANQKDLFHFFNKYIDPLLDDISAEGASYSYLEAQSCVSINRLGAIDLMKILKSEYVGVLAKGFDEAELRDILPNGEKERFNSYIMRSLNDPDKFQLAAQNRISFSEMARSSGIPESQINYIWNKFEGTMMSKDEIVEIARPEFPRIEELFKMWNDTPLKKLELTSVGIAIAHSNLVRIAGFDADLSIWIT